MKTEKGREWEKWHFMIGIMDVYITNNDGIMVHERNCIYDSIQPIMIFGHMVICIIYMWHYMDILLYQKITSLRRHCE